MWLSITGRGVESRRGVERTDVANKRWQEGEFFFFEARRRDVVLFWRDFAVFVPGLLGTVGLWRWRGEKRLVSERV
jgi:hypothetical protein